MYVFPDVLLLLQSVEIQGVIGAELLVQAVEKNPFS